MNKSPNPIVFVLGQMDFCIQYNLVDGKFFLHNGWHKFTQECGVENGDIVIIQLVDQSLRMKVCILKKDDIKSGNVHIYCIV